MSVYEELLEKKKQKRIKYELEQTKKDNQNINNKLSELKYAHSIALEQNRECNKKIDCYVLEIQRLNNIINEIFEWMQNKYDNSDFTGFTVSFQELQDLKELKEGK